MEYNNLNFEESLEIKKLTTTLNKLRNQSLIFRLVLIFDIFLLSIFLLSQKLEFTIVTTILLILLLIKNFSIDVDLKKYENKQKLAIKNDIIRHEEKVRYMERKRLEELEQLEKLK